MTLKQIEKKVTFIYDETGKKTSIALPPIIYEELIETLEECIDIRDIIKDAFIPDKIVYRLEGNKLVPYKKTLA